MTTPTMTGQIIADHYVLANGLRFYRLEQAKGVGVDYTKATPGAAISRSAVPLFVAWLTAQGMGLTNIDTPV